MATQTLNVIFTTKAKGDGAKKTEKGIRDLVKAAKAFAGVAIAKKVVEFTVEMTKLGAASQATALRFERFAGGSAEAARFLDAFNEGAQGTVDRMTAMASASQLLQMGLADTSDEMQQISAIAVQLGDQTQGAGERVNNFALMLANTSIPRLDSYGMSAGVVRTRMKELQESIAGLSREEAFKIAVLEEGAKSLDILGDTSETAATKIDRMTAAFKDTKIATAEAIATIVDMTGVLDAGGKSSRTYADQVRLFADSLAEVKQWGVDWRAFGEVMETSLMKGVAATDTYLDRVNTIGSATTSYTAMARAADEAASRTSEWSRVSDELRDKLEDQRVTTGELEHTIFNTADAIRREAIGSDNELVQAVADANRALEDQASAMDQVGLSATQMSDYLFDASMSFTDFYRRQEETAEDANQRLEDAEKKHQDKLAELAKRGQARAVKVDVAAEEEKLAALQRKLEIALQQESEFTDKVKASTKMRKDDQINSLRNQIAQQEGLLGDYHAGRLVKAGQNVDKLVGEEKRRYEEELALLEESRKEQEEEQNRSLGKMILQNFNAWAEMALAADGWTDEEIQYVQEMQGEIADEYGLIEDVAAQKVGNMQQKWADSLAIMRGDANSFFDAFITRFNALPSEKVLRIRTELSGGGDDLLGGKRTGGTGGGGGGGAPPSAPPARGGGGGSRGGDVQGGGLLSRTLIATGTAALMNTGGRGAPVAGGLTIGPVTIVSDDPVVIWKKLEQYARLKNKSGWQQLGR